MRVTRALPDYTAMLFDIVSPSFMVVCGTLAVPHRSCDRELWLKEKGKSSSTGTVPTSTVASLSWLVAQPADCSSTRLVLTVPCRGQSCCDYAGLGRDSQTTGYQPYQLNNGPPG